MASIIEILGAQNFGDHAIVEVLLDNGEAADVYIGGDVMCFYDTKHGKYKAIIKSKKDDNGVVDKEPN